jgi:Ca2+-binding EF-hand superfamily protein
MNNSSKVFSLGLLALLASTTLQAEELPSRGPIPFTVYDKDGNGVISEAEFNAVRSERMNQRATAGMPMRNTGNMPMFSAFDSNSDGQLTQEELMAGQQGRMGQRQGSGPGGGMGAGRNMPSYSEYDLDGNGAISEKEFYEARSKRISERAQQGYPMRNIGNAPAFGDIDSNKDGTISEEEFALHQRQHQRVPVR